MKTLYRILAVALVLVPPALAREVKGLADLEREIRILEDVFGAALRDTSEDRLRVGRVEGHYLVGQGALLSVDLTPGLGAYSFDMDGDLESLEQIPQMVHEIMRDLEIRFTPHEPEALEELHGLREAQRELREAQRELLADLRVKRHRLEDADLDDDVEALEQEIDALSQRLEAKEAEYEALNENVEAQYERLEALRETAEQQRRQASDRALDNIESAVIAAACDYGATLTRLPDDEHLNVIVNARDEQRLFVFAKSDLDSCRAGDLSRDALRERAYVYTP